MKKIGIMQPYFFPYIGYFQLIHSVDKILMYDDVNYIKNGWINRNRIMSKATGDTPVYFGLNLSGASSFKKIYDIKVDGGIRQRTKMLKTIKSCYGKSKSFENIYKIIEQVLLYESDNISEINVVGIKKICEYLNIDTHITSSSRGLGSEGLSGEGRVIDICKKLKYKKYINAIGGRELYDKDSFNSHDIELGFIKSGSFEYSWWNLSILHLLMIFDKAEVLKMLNNYKII